MDGTRVVLRAWNPLEGERYIRFRLRLLRGMHACALTQSCRLMFWMTWQIITGRMPFHEFTHDGGVVAGKVAGRHPLRPVDLPESSVTRIVWALMKQCWNTDPSVRPPASTVVQRVKKPPLTDATQHTMGKKLYIFLDGGSIVAAYTVTTSV